MKLKTLRIIFSTIAFFIVLCLLFAAYQIHLFDQNAGVSFISVLRQIRDGWNAKPVATAREDTIVFLILGTNEIQNRDIPPLTDTMMAASINVITGRVGLFSVPRDIWSTPYQTKIDALYTYCLTRYPKSPERFSKEVLGEMTGVSFDRTIVVTPDAFMAFVDTIGGIDINVTHPFVDTQYPKSDVNIFTETDPNKLYETVRFSAGWQHIDGARALIYVRSRHAEGSEGSDIARSRRQREVLSVIAAKLKHPQFYTDTGRLGKLYALYTKYMSPYLSIPDAVALTKELFPLRHNVSMIEGTFSIYPDQPDGAIYHPDFSPLNDGQWVFLIKNEDGFQKEIHATLGL